MPTIIATTARKPIPSSTLRADDAAASRSASDMPMVSVPT
jgi:hypothetical protein